MEYVALGISIVSVILAAAATWSAVTSSNASRRSASAAEGSQREAQRANDRLDQRDQDEAAEKAASAVRWVVEHERGLNYLLRNVGSAPAADVTATVAPDSADAARYLPVSELLQPGGAYRFEILRIGGLPRPTSLMVEWRGGDLVHVPIPPVPPAARRLTDR